MQKQWTQLVDAFPCHKEANRSLLSKAKSGFKDHKGTHRVSLKYHNYSRAVFKAKWPKLQKDIWELTATELLSSSMSKLKPGFPQFVLYPYFETHIPDLNTLGITSP